MQSWRKKSELKNLGATIDKTDIRRSSKQRTTDDCSVIAQTIVKLTNWTARSNAYATRFKGTLEERKKRPIYVNLDLTKRRRGLLKRAKAALQNHPSAHAYPNSECRLVVRNRARKENYLFNTDAELDDILGMLRVPETDTGLAQR